MPLPRISHAVHKPGITVEEKIEAYSAITGDYDEDVSDSGYKTPIRIAEMISKHYGSLAKIGNCVIDGFDPAENMLNHARERGVYRDLVCQGLLGEKLKADDGKYDVVTIGGFPNFPEPLYEGFPELMRVLKPGGSMVIAIRQAYYDDATFQELICTMIKRLEKEKKITTVVNEAFPDYFDNIPGKIVVLKKLV